MFTTKEAYRRAIQVDKLINKLLRDFPPELDGNKAGWRTFLRTVETTLHVINESSVKEPAKSPY